MTKIDERTPVPRIDAAARARLREALDCDGVVSAYLFGSQATGRTGPLSDIDLAIYVDPRASADHRDAIQILLANRAAEALDSGEIDVVLLNEAPPLLRHRSIKDGILLVERDPVARVRLETEGLLYYLDTSPLRATLAEGRRRRIAEG
ncbi:MAG: type VII toxin-antitoxin system MntA family adenylyltransferase antitoxin, partial [Thermoleophilaceae bacterium]